MSISDDKLILLAKQKQEKEARIQNKSIIGNYDADSVVFENGKAGRLTESGYYPQAPELKDSNGSLTQEGITARAYADEYMRGSVSAPTNIPTLDDYVQYKIQADKEAASSPVQITTTGEQGKYGRELYTSQHPNLPVSQADYLIFNNQAQMKQMDRGNEVVYGKSEPIQELQSPVDMNNAQSIYEASQGYVPEATVGNTAVGLGKSIAKGVVDVASSISHSPKALYDLLGGDYLEEGSEFSKQYPSYTKAVKSIITTMDNGSKVLDKFSDEVIDFDDRRVQKLQRDIGESFEEGNYATGLITAAVTNPVGALEMAGSSYGFMKAMASKGITALPAVMGTFTDNTDAALEIFKKEYGRKPNAEETSIIAGAAALGTIVDTAAAKVIMGKSGGSKTSEAVNSMLNNLIEKIPNKVAQAALKGTKAVGTLVAVEGAQEAFTEASVIAGGTQDIGKFSKPEYQKRIYESGAAGAVTGPGTKVIQTGESVAKEVMTKAPETLAKTKLDSKREKAPVKSTVPTSTTKEDVRSKLVDINTKFDNKSYATSKEVLDDVADLDTMVAGMQDEDVTKAIEQQKQYIYSKIAEEGLGEVVLGSEAEATQMIEDIVLYSEPTDNQRATINAIAERYGIDADKIVEVAKKGVTEYERLGRTLSRLNVDPVENEEKINKIISGLAAIEEANIYNQDILTEAVAEIEANIKSGTQISGTENVTLATGQEYDIEIKDGVINPEVYKTLESMQRNLEGIRAQYKNVNLDEAATKVNESSMTKPAPKTIAEIEDPSILIGKEALKPLVDEIISKRMEGKDVEFTPNELQFIDTYSKDIEARYKKIAEQPKGSIKEQVENSWSSAVESVEGVPTKISNIVEVNPKSRSKLSTQGIQSMSKTVSDYAKAAVDRLSKSILSVKPEVEKFKQKESPSRGLMFDIDGKMNENTAVAIRLGLDELLAYGIDDLVPKTKADVARIMGLQEYEVKDAMLKEFQNLGLNKTILADKLGRSIAKNMGIKPNKNIDEELYARLIADLGQTAIIYGEDMGALQMQDISAARYAEIIGEDIKGSGNIGFVKPSNKYLNADRKAQRESVKRTRKRYDAIAKELSIEPDEIKTYRNEPLPPKKKYKARNNPIADVPQKVVKVLNKMRQIKHTKVESSVEWIKSNRELAMKLLGYKEDMSGHSKQVQDSQDAKNAAIEKSIEELLNAEGSKFYFDWVYIKDGRYLIDSVTINPQSDKLHRFIIVPDSHNVDLDANDVDHMNKLRYALAQAVGFAVDKKSTKEILTKGQAVLDAGSVKLEKYLHSSKVEVEHLGHYLQAIEAVKNYENRVDGKFSTNITAEFDALTSGFGIKLMQFPILKDMVRWLEKVGVYTNKSMKSMNDELSSKGFTDSYQTLASQIKRGAVQPKYDSYKLWNELSAVLPEVVKGEAIASELRGLFKDPFMTFNYAAGMKSIKKSLSENIVDEIVEGIATGNKKYARLEYVLKRHVPNLRMELQNKELSDIVIGKSNLHKELTNLVFYTYGEQVQKIMETEFSEFVEANKVINSSFKTMFTEYKKFYDKAIKEVKDSGKPITAQKKIEIIRSLRDKFPMIKGPLSETREEGVAIYSTGKQDPISQKYKPAKTQRADGRQPTIQSLVREFEEAMSAGAVIPIHFIDGAVMNKVAEMFEAQYIHDAIMPNLLEMGKAVEGYNKAWYETNRDYSIIDELVDVMDKPSEGLLELQKKVQEGRKWLYEQNAEIGHMVGMEDGVYRKPEVEVEYNDEQKKIIKEFMSKPAISSMLKRNNIDMKDC